CPAAGHPVDLILKAFDVLGLLHELILRDHEGKLGLLMVGVEQLPDDGIDALSYGKSEGKPDAHALDRIAIVYDLRSHEQLVIPLAEIFLSRKLGLFALF